MNKEDIVKKSDALAASDDHTTKPPVATEEQPNFVEPGTPTTPELTEKPESNQPIIGQNDGFDEVLWPAFC